MRLCVRARRHSEGIRELGWRCGFGLCQTFDSSNEFTCDAAIRTVFHAYLNLSLAARVQSST
jgi:hypothetical protein